MLYHQALKISPPVSGNLVYEDPGAAAGNLNVAAGEVWSTEGILAEKERLFKVGQDWTIVENLIVHDSIKLGLPGASQYIRHYKESLFNLADCGIKVVCYNFMPVFYKLRTHYIIEEGKLPFSLFDPIALIAFDLFLLARTERAVTYDHYHLHLARSYFSKLDEVQQNILLENICRSVQGGIAVSCVELNKRIAAYLEIGDDQLTNNLKSFQQEIVPLCEELGIHLHFNDDDPCKRLFGLPSVLNAF